MSALQKLLDGSVDKILKFEIENEILRAQFKEKQLEIDECDLRCDELENTIQVAEAGLIFINVYLKISTLDEIAKDLNNAIKLGEIVK